MSAPPSEPTGPTPPARRPRPVSSGVGTRGFAPGQWPAVQHLLQTLPFDLSAGLTVALVALPQAVAIAMLAGAPPVYGLSTAAVTAFLVGVLGKSRQVATGPTTTTGLLVLGAITPYLGENGLIRPEHLSVLATLALLAGGIRLVVALGGGAHLVRFLPDSVLVGFTAGAATLIGGMQIDEALGLPPTRPAGLRSQVGAILGLIREGHHPELLAVLVAGGTILAVAAGRRLLPRVPVALLAVAASAIGASVLGLGGGAGLPLVSERSPVVSGWPPVAWPSFDPSLVEQLLVPASAIVLLGTLELAVSARARGARPDMRREIAAQGWANVAGAFTGCLPSSASLTRSALLRLSGARTRMAAALSGLMVFPALLFGSRFVGYVPQSALAGVLLAVAYGMVDKTALRRLWRASPETRLLVLLTFVATLVLPLEWAILLGSGTGLVIHLARTSAPRLRLLRPVEGGRRLVPTSASEDPECVVVEVSGNLHYAAVPPFLNEVEQLIPTSARCVVLDLSHAYEIRYTALRAFERLAELAHYSGASFVLAGVDEEVAALLGRCDSPLRFETAEVEPGLSVRRALEAGHVRSFNDPPP
jgi:SulP family sulfate permease